jgi:hypothetical protein
MWLGVQKQSAYGSIAFQMQVEIVHAERMPEPEGKKSASMLEELTSAWWDHVMPAETAYLKAAYAMLVQNAHTCDKRDVRGSLLKTHRTAGTPRAFDTAESVDAQAMAVKSKEEMGSRSLTSRTIRTFQRPFARQTCDHFAH